MQIYWSQQFHVSTHKRKIKICPDLTPSNESAQILTEINDESLSFVEKRKKMIEAYGATLTNSDDFDSNDTWV